MKLNNLKIIEDTTDNCYRRFLDKDLLIGPTDIQDAEDWELRCGLANADYVLVQATVRLDGSKITGYFVYVPDLAKHISFNTDNYTRVPVLPIKKETVSVNLLNNLERVAERGFVVAASIEEAEELYDIVNE